MFHIARNREADQARKEQREGARWRGEVILFVLKKLDKCILYVTG